MIINYMNFDHISLKKYISKLRQLSIEIDDDVRNADKYLQKICPHNEVMVVNFNGCSNDERAGAQLICSHCLATAMLQDSLPKDLSAEEISVILTTYLQKHERT